MLFCDQGVEDSKAIWVGDGTIGLFMVEPGVEEECTAGLLVFKLGDAEVCMVRVGVEGECTVGLFVVRPGVEGECTVIGLFVEGPGVKGECTNGHPAWIGPLKDVVVSL